MAKPESNSWQALSPYLDQVLELNDVERWHGWHLFASRIRPWLQTWRRYCASIASSRKSIFSSCLPLRWPLTRPWLARRSVRIP